LPSVAAIVPTAADQDAGQRAFETAEDAADDGAYTGAGADACGVSPA
jgi:hypothetical protein